MTFRAAQKLHNEDEVTVKKTGEIVTILNAYLDLVEGKPMVFVDVCTKDDGFTTLSHKEIR